LAKDISKEDWRAAMGSGSPAMPFSGRQVSSGQPVPGKKESTPCSLMWCGWCSQDPSDFEPPLTAAVFKPNQAALHPGFIVPQRGTGCDTGYFVTGAPRPFPFPPSLC